jgi:hypothetical protein
MSTPPGYRRRPGPDLRPRYRAPMFPGAHVAESPDKPAVIMATARS